MCNVTIKTNQMKIKAIAIIAFILSLTNVKAQSVFEKWPALNQFHEVMLQTFNPSEQGNLAPVKARSEELYTKAAALLKADIPAEYRTGSILSLSEKLQVKSNELNKLVLAKAPDAEISKSLNEVHKIYHEIEGLCSDKK